MTYFSMKGKGRTEFNIQDVIIVKKNNRSLFKTHAQILIKRYKKEMHRF